MTPFSRITMTPSPPFKPLAPRRPIRPPFPLEEPNCRIFHLARQGLFAGVKTLGLEPGDEVLVPAYHHGSEVEALVQAGIVCRFYEGGEHLEPVEEELETLLNARVRALHLIHYIGLPQDAARWRAWCDKHDLLLIEDAAQAWLSSREGVPVGTYGDLTIFCLYKTFGVPDGAAVISSPPVELPRLRRNLELKRVALRYASHVVQRSYWLAELRHRLRHDAEHAGRPDFQLGEPRGASHITMAYLLPWAMYPEAQVAQAARSANYAFLLERLEQLVPEPYSQLNEGASPYIFPILSSQKNKLLERLDRRGIGAWANFWSIPHPSLPTEGFERAWALRESVVGLPVHQDLSIRELDRIAEAVLDA